MKKFFLGMLLMFVFSMGSAQTHAFMQAARSINAPSIDFSQPFYCVAVHQKGTQLIYQAKDLRLQTTEFILYTSDSTQIHDIHNTEKNAIVNVNLPTGFRISAAEQDTIGSSSGKLKIILEPIPR